MMIMKLIAVAIFFTISVNGPELSLAAGSPLAMLTGFRTPAEVCHAQQANSYLHKVDSDDSAPSITPMTSITVDPPQSQVQDAERERLEQLQQQLLAKEKELAALRDRTTAATNQLHVEKTRAETLEAQLTQKEQELAGLCTQRDTHQQMSQELNRTKSSLELTKQQVIDSERQFAFNNDEAMRRIADLDLQVVAKEQELQQTKSNLDKLSQTVATLEKDLNERDVQLAQVKQLLAGSGRSLPKQSKTAATAKLTGPFTKVGAKLTSALQEELKRGAVVLRQDGDKLTVALSSGELFAQGRATMTPAGTALVKRIGTALRKFPPQSVEVAGHTDNIPVRLDNRRPFKDNSELSRARAEHAGQALIKSGLGADRVTTVGYADTQPIAPNETEEGRSKNRRVEIIVTQPSEPVATSGEKNEHVASTTRSAPPQGKIVQKVVNR